MQNKYKQLSRKLIRYSLCGIIAQCIVFASVYASGASKEKNTNEPVTTGLLRYEDVTVTGTVISSDDGTPLPGVSIVVKGTNRGTTTDADGKYTIRVPEGNVVLVFSFIGYITQEVVVSANTAIDVTLVSDTKQLDEVVVVGYGTQQKVTLTGAVSGIKGDEMLRTRNENPQNMLTGRIAGVRVWQKSSEPGTFNNNFDIRGLGAPLVVIDGVPRSAADFQRLNPSDIEDISVLKDASAAIYGVRAANGVVLITTKKGTKGKTSVTYNATYTLQKPSQMPRLANAYQTMTLYNEKSMNKLSGGTPIYDESDFEDFRNGTRRTTDWNSLILADHSPQTQHDLSINGGSEKTQYYVGMGYLYQEGFFKSGDLNYHKYNLRTNIDTEIAKGLTFNLILSGIADQRNTPYSTAVEIIRNYWAQGVLFPAYADPENTMLNYQGLDLEKNTVAMMTSDISGYRKYNQRYLQSTASLNFDFGTVSSDLEGLTAKGLISYDYRNDDNTIFRREYYQYAYNQSTGEYQSKLYNSSSPNRILRELFSKQQMLWQLRLNYNRSFGNHNVTGLLGLESQTQKGDNFYAQNDLAFGMDYLFAGTTGNQVSNMSSNLNDVYKFANSAMFGRLNYMFADRYIGEVQFRYDGSSKFAKGHQWGFFPSASAGWRISEEPFFQAISPLSFVNQLKLRGSYGLLGDDGDLQYDWATGYTYPAVGDNAAQGYYNHYAPGSTFNGQFVYGVDALALPNRMITWSSAHTMDIGLDFEGWNGLFGFSFDYFDRRRKELLERRNGDLPTVVGAKAPRENVNEDRHFGMDLQLSHRNKIGDFAYNVKVIGTITRQRYMVAVQKGPYGNSYDAWRNDNLNDRNQGVIFGYEKAGRFKDWEDIWSYGVYHGNDVLPGDYKYKDWNKDGEINSLDEHPITFNQTPWVNFSLSYDCSYKNFDLNFLWQGTAMGSMQYKEPLYSIWGPNGGGTLTQYLDRWHPVDPTADPYNPATQWVSGYYAYTGHSPIENSEFNIVSTAYLRLKSIELGYSLSKIRAFSSMKVRVFANAYNVLTITKVKFVDPEHPDDDLGRMYPLNKTYSVGISAKF